nr:MAG TPA: hypothetical protein [Caudoviricetes sp.]
MHFSLLRCIDCHHLSYKYEYQIDKFISGTKIEQ